MNTQTEQHTLQPGQPQWVWVERDTHLLVQRGAVAMALPVAWWDDATQRTAVTLAAGSAQRLQHAGWARLQAAGSRPAEVLCIAPPAPQARSGASAWLGRVSNALFGPRARRLHHLGPLARLGGNEAGERC